MDRFIKSLKSFAKEDFPVKQVSDFIFNSDFSKETLDKYSDFLLNLKEKYKIKLFHIINCGLILNAFALLNLFYNEFIVFIGLFALGCFTSVVEENYENKTTKTDK